MKNVSCLAEARFQFGRKTPLIWLDRFLLLGRILHLIISNRHSHLPQSSSSSTQTLYLIIYILPSEAFRPAKISLFHRPALFPAHFSPSAHTSPSKTANRLPQSPPPPTPLPHKRQVICLKSTNQNATKTPNSPCDHTAIGIFWTIAAEVIPWPLTFPSTRQKCDNAQKMRMKHGYIMKYLYLCFRQKCDKTQKMRIWKYRVRYISTGL